MFINLEYIKQAISETELIDLTAEDGEISINQLKVESCIDSANSLMVAYLRSRYSLPLDNIPMIIIDIGVQIAIYKLYQLRHRNKMPESITIAYENSLNLLKKYSTGELTIEVNIPDIARQSGMILKSKPKVFTEDILSRY